MSKKLAMKMRQKHRTGQYMGPAPMGAGLGGPCGPVQATQPQSWGAACPTGMCTSEDLASSLGRAVAGERYGCRELPYWLVLTADGAGDATLTTNSLVTICPTRILVVEEGNGAIPDRAVMTEFTMGNQNQIVGDPLPLNIISLDSYQTIPFVTDCLKAGLPFTITLAGLDPDLTYYVGLIGPAIG